MELRVVVAAGGREHEVVVSLQPGHTVGDLSAALANHVGAAPRQLHMDTVAGSRALDDEATVSAAGIVPGAVLRWAPREVPSPDWEVAVVGGPDAGRILPVPPDGGVLGRSRDVDLVVSDPFVSRQHLRLVPGPDGVVVEDLGSANGTRVGGTPVQPGSVVGDRPLELGSTLVVVRRHRRPRAPAASDVTATALVADDLAAAARSAAGGRTDPVTADRLVDAVSSRSVPLWIGRADAGLPVRVGWSLERDEPAGLELDLAQGPTLVQAGAATSAGHSTVRLLAVQATVLYPPWEVGVVAAIGADRSDDWDWLHWLPGAGPTGLLVGAAEAAAGLRRPPSRRRLVVIVDLSLGNSIDLLAAAAGIDGAMLVGLAAGGPDDATGRGAIDGGPWRQRVVIDANTGAVEVEADGHRRTGLGADGISADVARDLARRLAPLEERQPEAPADAQRPELTEAVWSVDPEGIAATWAAQRPRIAVAGIARDGPAGVDLGKAAATVVTGPAGSEVLATVCASLVTGVGPDRLAMAVHDPHGRLAALGELPHVVELAADAASLVDHLSVEAGRREALLAASGAADWAAWRARGDVVPAPLVVVADDADGRSSQPLRAWLGTAGDLGRLGISTVVATTTDTEPDRGAARVEVGPSGRAVVRRPDGSTVEVVVPVRTSQPADDASISVDALAHGRPSRTQGHTSLQRRSPVRDHLADVVAACVAAAAAGGLPRATWSPPTESFEHGRVHRTFVFTDIVGSTALVEVIGDAAWTDLVSWHDRALRAAFADHGGEEVDHAGDGFLVAFEHASDAVACAIAIQRRLAEHRSSSGFAPRVRVGGHTTDVVRHEGYKGHGLHVAARVGALSGGDQIVFSAATVDRVQPRPHTVNSRMVEVKGLSTPIEVLEVDWR